MTSLGTPYIANIERSIYILSKTTICCQSKIISDLVKYATAKAISNHADAMANE